MFANEQQSTTINSATILLRFRCTHLNVGRTSVVVLLCCCCCCCCCWVVVATIVVLLLFAIIVVPTDVGFLMVLLLLLCSCWVDAVGMLLLLSCCWSCFWCCFVVMAVTTATVVAIIVCLLRGLYLFFNFELKLLLKIKLAANKGLRCLVFINTYSNRILVTYLRMYFP